MTDSSNTILYQNSFIDLECQSGTFISLEQFRVIHDYVLNINTTTTLKLRYSIAKIASGTYTTTANIRNGNMIATRIA